MTTIAFHWISWWWRLRYANSIGVTGSRQVCNGLFGRTPCARAISTGPPQTGSKCRWRTSSNNDGRQLPGRYLNSIGLKSRRRRSMVNGAIYGVSVCAFCFAIDRCTRGWRGVRLLSAWCTRAGVIPRESTTLWPLEDDRSAWPRPEVRALPKLFVVWDEIGERLVIIYWIVSAFQRKARIFNCHRKHFETGAFTQRSI